MILENRGTLLQNDIPISDQLEKYIKKLNYNGYHVGVCYEGIIRSYVLKVYSYKRQFYKAISNEELFNSNELPTTIFLKILMKIVEENNIKLEEYHGRY